MNKREALAVLQVFESALRELRRVVERFEDEPPPLPPPAPPTSSPAPEPMGPWQDGEVVYPRLDVITAEAVPTRQAAFYLNRKPQTLLIWASKENGPVRPVRVGGRLAWRVEDIRRVLSGKRR